MSRPMKYQVNLDASQRSDLDEIVSRGVHQARVIRRARTLLLLDDGWSRSEVAEAVDVSLATITKTARDFCQEGLQGALFDKQRQGRPPKLTSRDEAKITAIATSEPPEGRSRWTLALIRDRFLVWSDLEDLSAESIRLVLKKNRLKPWQHQHWVISTLDTAFLAQMEQVLDVYERPYNPKHPVLCLDECPGQILRDVKPPLEAEPGRPRRQDYEYKRAGTYNVFLAVEPLAGWRYTDVRPRRTAVDFAEVLAAVLDRYDEAEEVTLVLDNLSTHKKTALWKAFPPSQALPMARRVRFVYTPVHGSWLNMAELEFAALKTQCLGDRRLESLEDVQQTVGAWTRSRNDCKATIDWGFTVDKSRSTFQRHYDEQFDWYDRAV